MSDQGSTDEQEGLQKILRLRLIVGIGFLILAVVYTQQASTLDFGRMERPGAGIYPTLIGYLFIGISLVAVLEPLLALRKGSGSVGAADVDPDKADRPGESSPKLLAFAAALAAWVFLVPILGFVVSTVAFIVGIAFTFQPDDATTRQRVTVAIIAVALTFGLRWFFLTVVGADLPGAEVGLFAA